MKSAHKLKCAGAIVVLGMLATTVPMVAEATPVDPAIIARFKKLAPFQQRLAALRNRLLIERGRRLFMTETFGGNGRTCATCHPPTNNFTIDPAFIARLPQSDPLFVAENNPALRELENPDLMRRFGLILENLDGFENPGVMRGVPHTLGLPVSTKVDPAQSNLTGALGWSGDGAPGDGTLRSFALGAITQHLTKTLNRTAGVDFRLPTESELDALEAFQASLGRQTEIDLAAMNFANTDVQAGRDLFNGVGINRACSACHNNAGANTAAGLNRNFNTHTENLSPGGPRDGGFGTAAAAGGGFGDETFNSTSVIEAADTPPFFHNNSARTIEDAVRFYTTPTFSADNAFALNATQVNQVAALLRALNALENIRSSNDLAGQAQRQLLQAQQTIRERVVPDTQDAIEVLSRGPLNLYPDAVALLDEALDLENEARGTAQRTNRNALLQQAVGLKEQARDLILQ
jgi:cytochrome c peroxidase